MRKISRITTQKKHTDRYNIFLDDGQGETYGFSVDEAVLIEYKLRKHMELDDATINALIQRDTLHKGYSLAINYLSYRMRTRKEINDYLIKKEVDEEHIAKIMEKLTNEKLIDDREFMNAFVQTRIQTTNKGPMLVKNELIQKGVNESIASEAADMYTFDIQYERAMKLAGKKMNASNNKSYRQQLQQLQATLMQKGFTTEVIQAVAAEVENEKDHDGEWEALNRQGEKLMRKHQPKMSGHHLRNKIKEGLYRKGFTIELINSYLDEILVDD